MEQSATTAIAYKVLSRMGKTVLEVLVGTSGRRRTSTRKAVDHQLPPQLRDDLQVIDEVVKGAGDGSVVWKDGEDPSVLNPTGPEADPSASGLAAAEARRLKRPHCYIMG